MAIVCPLCPQDACCHFKPLSPDPFIIKDTDQAVAKFGHLNHLVNSICCISNDLVALTSSILTGSETLNFPLTLAQTSSELTISVVGAIVGSPVVVGIPTLPNINTAYTGYVSALGIVTIRFNNYSLLSVNPASGIFTVKVFL